MVMQPKDLKQWEVVQDIQMNLPAHVFALSCLDDSTAYQMHSWWLDEGEAAFLEWREGRDEPF